MDVPDESASIPTGVVTFLFTDVEGSTRLWAADRDAMAASLRVHDAIIRVAIESRAGYVFTTAGDAFCAAFQRASLAIEAAAAAQDELASADWPGPALRVRMGLHLGEADERGGDYFGPVVNTAARVEAAGHGGQVLLTDAVHAETGADGSDLGEHNLRGLDAPVRIWQLGHGAYPRVRTGLRAPSLPNPPTRLVGRDALVHDVRLRLRGSRLVPPTWPGSWPHARHSSCWTTVSTSSTHVPNSLNSSLPVTVRRRSWRRAVSGWT